MTRCACIDIGSNTTRLLVAEPAGGRLREVVSERAFTLLGAAGGEPGAVGQAKIDEVAAAVERQVRVADELGVASLRVVATAAVRGALDRAALAAAIDAACGARMEILDEQDEARLAFHGAIGMLARCPPGLLGVVDVGGGSTELVVGTPRGGVTWSVSLPLGSAVITRSSALSDPPTASELTRVREELATRFAAVQAPRPAVAYAVGGSATSMQRLIGVALDREALARGLQALVTAPAAEVALRLGLHPERTRLLPAGILLLDAASRALRAPLRFAGGGLREGVVFEQLAALRT
ncbi:MAG: exopolyphosphatase / guanosine-5-triphosphate,3-diphosphate pyrophosphatase [Solirubrobacteraceae bacterium]|nr:exopolyphosphatase / guanosine-5-triphosphate,3-diphosphate pyrophosphatase [Solirubrobacteraceae bacterium]